MTIAQLSVLTGLLLTLCCVLIVGAGLIIQRVQNTGPGFTTFLVSATSTAQPAIQSFVMPTLPPEWTADPNEQGGAPTPSVIDRSARVFRRQVVSDFNEFYVPAIYDLAELLTAAADHPSYRHDSQWQEDVAAVFAVLRVTAESLEALNGPPNCRSIEELLDELLVVTNAFVEHESNAIVTLSEYEVEQATLYSNRLNRLVDNINRELSTGSCR